MSMLLLFLFIVSIIFNTILYFSNTQITQQLAALSTMTMMMMMKRKILVMRTAGRKTMMILVSSQRMTSKAYLPKFQNLPWVTKQLLQARPSRLLAQASSQSFTRTRLGSRIPPPGQRSVQSMALPSWVPFLSLTFGKVKKHACAAVFKSCVAAVLLLRKHISSVFQQICTF